MNTPQKTSPAVPEEWEEQVLTCRECGRRFVFTAGEQAYYREKGLDKPPRRCKQCRRAARGQRPLWKAVCAACGQEAQVPFAPREDQLVYCADCYAQMRK